MSSASRRRPQSHCWTTFKYTHSVALLQEWYGDKQKLTDAHVQPLVELKNPSNSLTSLELFYDSIESHIWSLQSLGTTQEMHESMLDPIILRKLPTELHKSLARAHGTEKWTLKDLCCCILQELRILDVGTDYSTSPHTPTAAFTAEVAHKLPPKTSQSPTC